MSGPPFQQQQLRASAAVNVNSIANVNFEHTSESSSVAAQRLPQTNTNRTTPDSGLGNDDQSKEKVRAPTKFNGQRRVADKYQQAMRGSGPPPSSQGPHNSGMYFNAQQQPYNGPPGAGPHDGPFDGKPYDSSQPPQYAFDPRVPRYQQGPMEGNMPYDESNGNPNSFPIHGVNEGYDRPPHQQQQQPYQHQHVQSIGVYDQADPSSVNFRQNYAPQHQQQQMYGSQGPPPNMYPGHMMSQSSHYPQGAPGNFRQTNMGPPGQAQQPGPYQMIGVPQNVGQPMFQQMPQMMPMVVGQGQQLFMPYPCGVVKKANPSPSASSDKDRQNTQPKRSGKYGSQQSLDNQDAHPDTLPPSQQFEMNMAQTPEGYAPNQYNQMQYQQRVLGAQQMHQYPGPPFAQQQMHAMHAPPPPPPPHIMPQMQYQQQTPPPPQQQQQHMYQQYQRGGGAAGMGGGRPDGMMTYQQQGHRGGFQQNPQQQQYHGGRGGNVRGNGRGRGGGYQQNQHSRQNSGQYGGGYDGRNNYSNYGRGGGNGQHFDSSQYNPHDNGGSIDEDINALANRIEHLEPSSNNRTSSPSKQMLQLIESKPADSTTSAEQQAADGQVETSNDPPTNEEEPKRSDNNEPEEENIHGSEEETAVNSTQKLEIGGATQKKLFCYKCDQMKLPTEEVESHCIRHSDGTTWCPTLRKEVCPICQKTGDESHSPLLCPLVKDEPEDSQESTRDSSVQRDDAEQYAEQLPDSSSGNQDQQRRRGYPPAGPSTRGNVMRRGANRGGAGGQYRNSTRNSKNYQD